MGWHAAGRQAPTVSMQPGVDAGPQLFPADGVSSREIDPHMSFELLVIEHVASMKIVSTRSTGRAEETAARGRCRSATRMLQRNLWTVLVDEMPTTHFMFDVTSAMQEVRRAARAHSTR